MVISTVAEVSELEDCKTIKYKHFTIHYNNKESAISTFNEIFNDKYYLIKTDTASPLIIDGGANIGIATIFFKDICIHRQGSFVLNLILMLFRY